MFRGGGCCPPMDLMRSETMQLVQVIIPAESARLAVSNLGDLGLVQSKDVNIQTEAFSEKYLGLPTAVGKLTSEAFEYITESARSSVNGWAEKNLSYPAKSIELVKETLQTLELPRENPKPTRLVAKWQRPPDGFVKINSDGAFNVSENLAATGVVAREGLLYRGAMGKTYRGISDPLIIETLALRDAVTYARDRGFSRVVFEVDSENLVHLWHNRAADRSMVKNVLDEIDKSPFQRTYAAQIKRCGEMTRKMHFFKEQMSKAAILTSSTKFSGAPLEIDDLEIKLGEFETDLIEVNTNNGKLQRTYNELVEYNVLLQKTGEFFYSAQRSAAQQQSEIVADQFGDSSLESPLMEQEMVTDPLKQVKLGFLSGLVPKQKAMAFERILFRATRGNMLLQQESVDEPVTDPQFGEKVVKNSFVIFYSGERAKSKIVKICDAFGANRYPFPEDLAKQLHTIQEVGVYPRVLFLNPSLWSFCFVN
ncbi:hypothetical protein ACQ4PT_070100 [Festuca glaucescens]